MKFFQRKKNKKLKSQAASTTSGFTAASNGQCSNDVRAAATMGTSSTAAAEMDVRATASCNGQLDSDTINGNSHLSPLRSMTSRAPVGAENRSLRKRDSFEVIEEWVIHTTPDVKRRHPLATRHDSDDDDTDMTSLPSHIEEALCSSLNSALNLQVTSRATADNSHNDFTPSSQNKLSPSCNNGQLNALKNGYNKTRLSSRDSCQDDNDEEEQIKCDCDQIVASLSAASDAAAINGSNDRATSTLAHEHDFADIKRQVLIDRDSTSTLREISGAADFVLPPTTNSNATPTCTSSSCTAALNCCDLLVSHDQGHSKHNDQSSSSISSSVDTSSGATTPIIESPSLADDDYNDIMFNYTSSVTSSQLAGAPIKRHDSFEILEQWFEETLPQPEEMDALVAASRNCDVSKQEVDEKRTLVDDVENNKTNSEPAVKVNNDQDLTCLRQTLKLHVPQHGGSEADTHLLRSVSDRLTSQWRDVDVDVEADDVTEVDNNRRVFVEPNFILVSPTSSEGGHPSSGDITLQLVSPRLSTESQTNGDASPGLIFQEPYFCPSPLPTPNPSRAVSPRARSPYPAAAMLSPEATWRFPGASSSHLLQRQRSSETTSSNLSSPRYAMTSRGGSQRGSCSSDVFDAASTDSGAGSSMTSSSSTNDVTTLTRKTSSSWNRKRANTGSGSERTVTSALPRPQASPRKRLLQRTLTPKPTKVKPLWLTRRYHSEEGDSPKLSSPRSPKVAERPKDDLDLPADASQRFKVAYDYNGRRTLVPVLTSPSPKELTSVLRTEMTSLATPLRQKGASRIG